MKISNLWMVVLMAISFSIGLSACSNSEDDTNNNSNEAKALAGTYSGYSVGKSRMFSDYLMGEQASAVITANEDGTMNLTYKSGSGDFTLENVKVSSKAFSGAGTVSLAMNGGAGSSYEYTLEGSVNDSKELTIKATIPAVMGGLEVTFVQHTGAVPAIYFINSTYKYNTNLALTINGTAYGSTENCQASIKKSADNTTADITFTGFGNINTTTKSAGMNLADFTVKNVTATKAENGGYTLSIGAFESTADATAITGQSLTGTIAADGTAAITVIFKPGSMPIAITAAFSGSNTATSTAE